MDDNSNMRTDTTLLGEEARKRFDHVAVRLDHYIVVLGGSWLRDDVKEPLPLNVIWMYNLYTEQWIKHRIPVIKMVPPPTDQGCAAMIDSDIYMFGGNISKLKTQTNALCKLSRTLNACFEWSKIEVLSKAKSPSPRSQHSGWEYDGKLWTFGGWSKSPIGFLNDHGDYDFQTRGNNQLLCFDPTSQEWRNPKCSGSVPQPVAGHAATIIADNVWQFGGYTGVCVDSLYKLHMPSFFWTKIEAGFPWPTNRAFCSFTALANSYLVLHGGFDDENYRTSVLDLSTLSWNELKFIVDLPRLGHTCTRDINSNSVVIGGDYELGDDRSYGDCLSHENLHVMLEAKSLQ